MGAVGDKKRGPISPIKIRISSELKNLKNIGNLHMCFKFSFVFEITKINEKINETKQKTLSTSFAKEGGRSILFILQPK